MTKNSMLEQLTGNGARTRRQVLKTLGASAAVVAALPMLGRRSAALAAQAPAADADILQFALNLEYLEAEYYLYATTGKGLPASDIGGSGTLGETIIKDNPKVPFESPLIEGYGNEIADDEKDHVEYLRAALASLGITPVARPPLDLLNSFNTLAQAAGIGDSFDPFENEVNFVLGAFIFEDVGVTAYRGGAGLISDPSLVSAAAGVLGTEAYHAGNIRTVLVALQDDTVTDTAQKIADLRDALDGPRASDGGLYKKGEINVVLTDPKGLVFARSTRQVLNIVYGAQGAHQGLFFPNGLNGVIS